MTDDFPAHSIDDWRAAAEKALRGKPLESVTWEHEDEFEVAPVVTAAANPRVSSSVPRLVGFAGLPDTELDQTRHVAAHELEHGHDVILIGNADHAAALVAAHAPGSILLEVDDESALDEPLRQLLSGGRAAGAVLLSSEDQYPAAVQLAQIVSRVRRVLATDAMSAFSDRLVVEVPVGTELLTEVAKLRALRVLLSACPDLRVYARTSHYIDTRFEPHTNLLRVGLAGFAAFSGGADFLGLSPFDMLSDEHEGCDSVRHAVNQFHLMAEESSLGRVEDPFAGSHVVEHLTAELIRGAEAHIETLRTADEDDDTFDELVDRREFAIAEGDRVIVGINRFADPSRDDEIAPYEDGDYTWRFGAADLEYEDRMVEQSFIGNGALPFDWLRGRMCAHVRTGAPRATASVVVVGDAKPGRAADILRCGGFDVTTPPAFADIDAAVAHVDAANPQVVVFAGADGERFANRHVFTAADIDDLDDIVEFLADLQDRLGIPRLP